MCGRYLITSTPEAIRALFRYPELPNFPPRYNVAPTQPIPIVRMWEGNRQFALVRWGLMPSWVEDPKNFPLLFNARSDSLLDKPAFRSAMRYRRCLVPADGFYEWMNDGGRKRPFAVLPAASGPIAFAGLWETWSGPNGEEVDTATIITTASSGALRHLHPRMPVVIAPEAFDAWLDCRNVDAEVAATLLTPAPDDFFRAYEVSPAVNHVANDAAEVLTPASELPPPPVEPVRARSRDKRDTGQGSLF